MTVGAMRNCRSEFHIKEEAGFLFLKLFYVSLFPMETFFNKIKTMYLVDRSCPQDTNIYSKTVIIPAKRSFRASFA